MPWPVAAGAGQGMGSSQHSIGPIGLAGFARRTGASVLEPSGVPHALAFWIGALVGALTELFADERIGKALQWQASARRALMAAALDRVLAKEVEPRADVEQGGTQEGPHGTA